MDLVLSKNGTQITTSNIVASHFGKQHREILKKVRKIIEIDPKFGGGNFSLSSYESEQRKVLPCYEMTRDGFAILAMELSGKNVFKWKVKFIEAFNMMEESLYNIDYRMSKILIDSDNIKEAGRQWGALGNQIKIDKNANKLKRKELLDEVQFKLEFKEK